MRGERWTVVGVLCLISAGLGTALQSQWLQAGAMPSDRSAAAARSGDDATIASASSGLEDRLIEQAAGHPRLGRIRATIEPLTVERSGGGAAAGVCPPEVQTYSDVDFTGGEFILQAGMVAEEIAAAQYFAEPEEFPLILNVAEIIWAQQEAIVTTTTEWSILVWEGNPVSGNLVAEFSSDNKILPHVVIPPGTNGVNLQIEVDPDDPDQIVIAGNPSNSFTVGFRIDQHNNPPTTNCPCVPGFPQIGLLPAICCPPPTDSNAFPTTDPSGLTAPTQNWLYARDCPGSTGLCEPLFGWFQFTQSGLPTGDWNIRVTYTPFTCVEEFGACCLPVGGCVNLTVSECEAENGIFLGDRTDCATSTCPEPVGACCTGEPGGVISCEEITEAQCLADDGTWGGAGSDCDAGACDPVLGACCVPATGACVNLAEDVCDGVGGIWQGKGTDCGTVVCFPSGACCLPDGSCLEDVSPDECAAEGGEFQGDGVTCAEADCPLPTGACCLPNGNCFVFDEATCLAVAGSWAGAGTDCADDNGNGSADACEDSTNCPADLNGDTSINVLDMLALLSVWGTCDDPGDCPADLNGDTVVNVLDLLELLAAWGACE